MNTAPDSALKPKTPPEGTLAFPLNGKPYEQRNGRLVRSCNKSVEGLATDTRYPTRLKAILRSHRNNLVPFREGGFKALDRKLKSPERLSFEEAFSASAYICLSSNLVLRNLLFPDLPESEKTIDTQGLSLRSVSLLQILSTREALIGFSPTELAGLVAGVVELDTVFRVKSQPAIAIGGMGGDKGITRKKAENSKLFSVSTLAALATAVLHPAHKHHSYPNTSKVAGQSTIEAFGARSDFRTLKEMENISQKTGLLMTSCHCARSLHTISHVLKGETINHAVGPLAFPIEASVPLNGFIGVNHNVHPETLVCTLRILHKRKIQTYSNSVAFCAVDLRNVNSVDDLLSADSYDRNPGLKELVRLDEVAPPPLATLASFLVNNRIQTVIIEPEDFMPPPELKLLKESDFMIPNKKDRILQANSNAIRGSNYTQAAYIAMSTALAVFTREEAHKKDAFVKRNGKLRVNTDKLRASFQKAFDVIKRGDAKEKLASYVSLTTNNISRGTREDLNLRKETIFS